MWQATALGAATRLKSNCISLVSSLKAAFWKLERRPSLPDLAREQAADYRLMART